MSNSEQFSLSEILQIAIPVRDVAEAVTFYRDTLGIQFLFEAPPPTGFLPMRFSEAHVECSRRA